MSEVVSVRWGCIIEQSKFCICSHFVQILPFLRSSRRHLARTRPKLGHFDGTVCLDHCKIADGNDFQRSALYMIGPWDVVLGLKSAMRKFLHQCLALAVYLDAERSSVGLFGTVRVRLILFSRGKMQAFRFWQFGLIRRLDHVRLSL